MSVLGEAIKEVLEQRRSIQLPTNIISTHALDEISSYLCTFFKRKYSTQNVPYRDMYEVRDAIVRDIGTELVTDRGRWTVRLSRYFYELGHKLQTPQKSRVGDIISKYRFPDGEHNYYVTRWVNWKPGMFGDYRSCVMTPGAFMHNMLDFIWASGGGAILVPANESLNESSRCFWWDSEYGLMITNAYGSIELNQFALILTSLGEELGIDNLKIKQHPVTSDPSGSTTFNTSPVFIGTDDEISSMKFSSDDRVVIRYNRPAPGRKSYPPPFYFCSQCNKFLDEEPITIVGGGFDIPHDNRSVAEQKLFVCRDCYPKMLRWCWWRHETGPHINFMRTVNYGSVHLLEYYKHFRKVLGGRRHPEFLTYNVLIRNKYGEESSEYVLPKDVHFESGNLYLSDDLSEYLSKAGLYNIVEIKSMYHLAEKPEWWDEENEEFVIVNRGLDTGLDVVYTKDGWVNRSELG